MFLADDSDVIEARYYVRIASTYSLKDGLDIIASEESIGIESITSEQSIRIYPGITSASISVRERVSAQYKIEEEISKQSAIVCIRFPLHNLDQPFSLVPILLSTIAGDLFGLEVVEDIRLLQVDWPNNYRSRFPGPKFGLDGILRILKTKPPLLGAIIKPNIGLSPAETADLVRRLMLGGADFIKDDELHCSLDETSIFDRVRRVRDVINDVKAQTGRECLYAVNITADTDRIMELATRVVAAGANCLMLNIFATGFDTIKMLATSNTIAVPIHTHRCIHDVFTARNTFGVAPVVFAELARLCGADFYHIGTPNGKPKDKLDEMRAAHKSLLFKIPGMPQTIPVSSRASSLSIPNALSSFRDVPNMMFLSCGAIYRPPGEIEGAMRALREGLALTAHGQTPSSDDYPRVTRYLKSLGPLPIQQKEVP